LEIKNSRSQELAVNSVLFIYIFLSTAIYYSATVNKHMYTSMIQSYLQRLVINTAYINKKPVYVDLLPLLDKGKAALKLHYVSSIRSTS